MHQLHTITRRTAIAGAAATLAAAAARSAASAADAVPAALVNAAKAEGGVVVDGPPIDAVRTALVSGFQKAHGIPLTYISSGTSRSGARVRAERAAGKYLLDVFISGSDTPTLTFLPSGWLDRIEPILVAPDVTDKHDWKGGHLWFEDPANTILRVQQGVVPELALNTKTVRPSEVSTWRSLLDPKWKGKIVAKDPAGSGAGASLISFFYLKFGADFVKNLYVNQQPVLTNDERQLVQWVAEDNYPIALGPDPAQLVRFMQLGYPIQPIFPTDAPSILTGGWGLVGLLNKAPHPNAAQLFINWFAGPSAQLAYAGATQTPSLRTDLKYSTLPSFVFPQKGVQYLDTYAYPYVTVDRNAALPKARALLGE